MTKLKIGTRNFGYGYGHQVVLLDQDGDVLPGQESIKLESSAGSLSKITVTFIIDNTDIEVLPTKD